MTRAEYCAGKAKAAQDAIDEIVSRGTKSGTVSSGGATESYTGLDIPTLERTRDYWLKQYARANGRRQHGAANFG
jgi:hypothetical protein